MTNKHIYYCINCGAQLDSMRDFIVNDNELGITVCKDCYNLPEWYELFNK